jgi:sec-independent protein translocase protein TatC
MTLVEHLSELRWRIIGCILGIAACACITLWKAAALTRIIIKTAPSIQFIALTPMEIFFTEFKIGLISAVILAVPIIFWQIWSFVSPGLRDSEQRLVWVVVPAASILFGVGAAFAFFVVIPMGVDFLSSFSLEGVQNHYSLEAYTSFVLFFVLSFGLIFEAPLLILALAKLGLVTYAGLVQRRRIVILGCFVVAAVLTPTPDMVNQSLMALPMWLLFEGTLVVMRVMGW